MASTADADLYRRAAALLEPGDVDLVGAVLHTSYDGDEESRLHQTTVEAGDAIAAELDAGDTYVYSGTDDSEFGLNQHQGLRLEDDAFVWECQQLLRDGTFDVVFYWMSSGRHRAVVDALRDVEGVAAAAGITPDGPVDDATTDES